MIAFYNEKVDIVVDAFRVSAAYALTDPPYRSFHRSRRKRPRTPLMRGVYVCSRSEVQPSAHLEHV